jgi:hypothetical protein
MGIHSPVAFANAHLSGEIWVGISTPPFNPFKNFRISILVLSPFYKLTSFSIGGDKLLSSFDITTPCTVQASCRPRNNIGCIGIEGTRSREIPAYCAMAWQNSKRAPDSLLDKKKTYYNAELLIEGLNY